jgi:hypothetical protein
LHKKKKESFRCCSSNNILLSFYSHWWNIIHAVPWQLYILFCKWRCHGYWNFLFHDVWCFSFVIDVEREHIYVSEWCSKYEYIFIHGSKIQPKVSSQIAYRWGGRRSLLYRWLFGCFSIGVENFFFFFSFKFHQFESP